MTDPPRQSTKTTYGGLTAIERIIADLPGPYLLWAAFFAAVLGVPGLLAARYADTGSMERALTLFPLLVPDAVTYNLANGGLILYALVGIRFMRRRTLVARTQLAPLLPAGTEVPDHIFAPVTKFLPPLVLTPILLGVSFAAFPDQVQDVTGPAYFVLKAIGLPISYFVYATFTWVYLSSIRGLDRLGKMPLHLRSFMEDSHLGLRPFGSLSLSLALVYLLGLALVAFSFLSLPPLIIALIAALALPGIALFFIPLLALRRRMLAEARVANQALVAALARAKPFLEPTDNGFDPLGPDGPTSLLALQIVEHRASEVSHWPLDLRTMSWFSAIVLSVLAAIVTRYVLSYLGP